mmetsp:Transcript_9221/g.29357  ORF Transcript_9221/g.29357 Transcript_9221/m.29357 type:complete len:217 (-) Transcript_9221:149-799(-)
MSPCRPTAATSSLARDASTATAPSSPRVVSCAAPAARSLLRCARALTAKTAACAMHKPAATLKTAPDPPDNDSSNAARAISTNASREWDNANRVEFGLWVSVHQEVKVKRRPRERAREMQTVVRVVVLVAGQVEQGSERDRAKWQESEVAHVHRVHKRDELSLPGEQERAMASGGLDDDSTVVSWCWSVGRTVTSAAWQTAGPPGHATTPATSSTT